MIYETIPLTIDPSMASVIAVIAWSLFWDGLGLWYSARNKQKIWFLAILVLKTVGILSIIYVFLFSKTPLLDELDKWGRKKFRKRKSKSSRKKR